MTEDARPGERADVPGSGGRGPCLDLEPLTTGAGVRACLRALGRRPLWIIATTIGVLTILVPVAWLVLLLAAGGDITGEGLFGAGFFVLCGSFVMVDVVSRARGAGAWSEFARVNDLEPLTGTTMPHYAGRPFACGSHLVLQAVRTRGERFIEVGDRFPIEAPRRPEDAPEPELYLRARLSGRAGPARRGAPLVTPDLHAELTSLAGHYTVEMSGDELTVLGTRPLGAREPTRIAAAFALLEALVTRAETELVAPYAGADEVTTSGIPIPVMPRERVVEGRPASALTVVALTLVLLIAVPTVLTVVMVNIEGSLRGNRLGATVVVSLVVAVVFVMVGLLIRVVSRPRAGRAPARRR